MNQEFVPANAVRTRKFEVGRNGGIWAINGMGWDTQRVDATPRNGDIEIWEFYNKAGGWWHPMHIHLLIDGFKILDRNGKPPRPYELGLKMLHSLVKTSTSALSVGGVPFLVDLSSTVTMIITKTTT
jgi:FtsP/CotA-like multicopper oxidase with cupredoxin domain